MDLLTVGINHRTAPVALREKIAFTAEQLGEALRDLKAAAQMEELAILSTCNRTEIYAVNPRKETSTVVEWLAAYHDLPLGELMNSIYVHDTDASLRHLLRVAAGLDSMVLGEPQILGQVKDCFAQAKANGTLGPTLDRLSQNTYRVAKRVRSNTAIGQTPVSVASIAVDLARQLFSDIGRCHVTLIGAGETIELVGRHLRQAGARHLVIANRTLANATSLADELDGDAATLSELPALLVDTDILIASTGSQLPILGKGTVERAVKERRHKPIFMVDLAVPRDIEPEISELADVYLYSIDDLEQIIAGNMSNRAEAAAEAETIVDEAVVQLLAIDKSLDAVDVLVNFRKRHERLKEQELERALARLAKGEDPERVLTGLANQLTNKIIHTPSVRIKEASTQGQNDIIRAVSQLYELDDEGGNDQT
ncbi:MAG: glutamyl-tRNA reductase [Pseudomonadales bacterium]|nr:glutamyl-tRNA reductase [Pseudomonadales bacterium]